MLAALPNGRAAFKAALAAEMPLDVARLPFNADLLALLRTEKSQGRRIYLASAADARYVRAVAEELGLFDGVFASDGTTNLKGAAKARVLCEAFGRGGFDYAGNSLADLPVWQDAAGVLVVNEVPRRACCAYDGARRFPRCRRS